MDCHVTNQLLTPYRSRRSKGDGVFLSYVFLMFEIVYNGSINLSDLEELLDLNARNFFNIFGIRIVQLNNSEFCAIRCKHCFSEICIPVDGKFVIMTQSRSFSHGWLTSVVRLFNLPSVQLRSLVVRLLATVTGVNVEHAEN